MKKIYILVLVGLCLCLVSTAQAEVQYLGELCFQLSTAGTRATQILKLEVLSYNTATFPIHGSIFYEYTCPYTCPPQWNPIYGDAVLAYNTIKISLNTSGADWADELLSQSYSLFLDPTTLNGTFSSTAVQAPSSAGQSPSLQSSSGIVTLTTCAP